MPFDASPEFDVLTFSPGKEGLRKLAYVLRHVKTWPARWTWDYLTIIARHECGTRGCAAGLAKVLWPNDFCPVPDSDVWMSDEIAAHVFGMPLKQADALFYGGHDTYGKPAPLVKPGDVADAIDRYLATGKVSP